MKRYALITTLGLILCVCLLLVTGGGGKKRGGREVVFWHSMSIYQSDTLERLVARYNDRQNRVVINPVFQGLYDELKTKLRHAMKSKDQPDIAQVAVEYIDVFVADGLVEPITDFVPEEDRNDILDQFWNTVTRDREIYAYPFNMSVQVLYYNKGAFRSVGLDPDKPPKTWSETIQYASRLTRDENGDGRIDQWGIMVSLEGVYGFTPLIRQLGGEFLSENGTRAVFNGPEGVRAMEFIRSLVHRHRVMPANWTIFEGAGAFLEGEIAMGPISSAGVRYAEDNLPWELGVAPLPYLENKSVLLGGAGIINLNRSAGKTREVVDFMRWLTSSENTSLWHRETGYLPVRRSSLESPELDAFHRSNPNYKVAVDQLPYARPPDFSPLLPQMDRIIRSAIEGILILKRDPESELDNAARKINELLDRTE